LKDFQNEVGEGMTRKIRVILMGGLGNQLFQYAFALSLSKKYGREVIIDPNFAAIRLDENGLPEISKYGLDANVFLAEHAEYPALVKRMVGLGIRLGLAHERIFNKFALTLLNRLLEVYLSIHFKESVQIVLGKDNGFDQSYSEKDFSLFIGYFQSYEFSSALSVKETLDSLKPKTNSSIVTSFTEKADFDAPLIVHVRLTDYRNEVNFGIPSKDYYERAITDQIQTGLFRRIWLFSDEPNEAVDFIPERYRLLVENVSNQNLGTVDTLEVMRLGRGYVIANSSYSWWGAYLSRNPAARTIFPNPWFSGMPTPDRLCPPDWLPFTR
jgi:hypothetical protein